MALHLQISGLSDVGRLRRRNEDAYALLETPAPLLAVADGMGGHPAGDVASALAVQAVRTALGQDGELPEGSRGDAWEDSPSPLGRRMLEAVERAERSIGEDTARNPERQGMGTTLTAMVVRPGDGRWAIGHVGDSRAYRWAGDRLQQLTQDHTWVQDQVARGAIPAEEARGHPWSHILAQALGTGQTRPQIVEGRAKPGEVYLLCTDGLTTMLGDADLACIVRESLHEGLPSLAARLVAAANDRGGADNITVALLAVAPPATPAG